MMIFKNKLTKYIFILVFIGIAIVAISSMSTVLADTHTAISSGVASNGAIWDKSAAPDTGDNIVMGGSYSITFDIAKTFGTFTVSGSTVTQSSINFGCTDFTLSSGTYTGSYKYKVTISGNFLKSGGTLSGQYSWFVFTGTGKTFNANSVVILYGFEVSGSLTIVTFNSITVYGSSGSSPYTSFVVSGTLVIGGEPYPSTPSAINVNMGGAAADVFTNSGTIMGNGVLVLQMNGDKTITFGNVKCQIQVWMNTMTSGRILTLGDSITSYPARFSIISYYASYTMTVQMNGKSIFAREIGIGPYAILKNSGAKAWLHASYGIMNTSTYGLLYTANLYISQCDWYPSLSTMPVPWCLVNTVYSYTPSFNETVTSLTLVDKPAWASMSNGVISGTPSSKGNYSFNFTAYSQNGTLTGRFPYNVCVTGYTYVNTTTWFNTTIWVNTTLWNNITIWNNRTIYAPEITSTPNCLIENGTFYSYHITLNESSIIVILNKPTWLTYSNYWLNGTSPINETNAYYVSIKATSLVGNSSATQSFDILNYKENVPSSFDWSYIFFIIVCLGVVIFALILWVVIK